MMNNSQSFSELDSQRFQLRLVEASQETIQKIFYNLEVTTSMKTYRVETNRVVVKEGDSGERELAELSGNWSEDSVTIGKAILTDCLDPNAAEDAELLNEMMNGPVASMKDADSSSLEESQVQLLKERVDARR